MRTALIAVICVSVFAAPSTAQSDLPWSQLSLSAAHVDAYRKDHPNQDGRGIVIAVLDTGVDMGVAGLEQTSTGEIKVIDVQDFSTQGDVEIERAHWNAEKDKIVHYDKNGAPELFTPPAEGKRPDGTTVWFGLLKENAFKNSAVSDVNDNGRKDDIFGICVVAHDDGTDDDAVCFIDTNSDRDFSDEKPLMNYKIKFDKFTFPRAKKEKQTEPLTCALNIFLKKRKVVLHYDDGGHGTHVAGIAAGHRIMNQDGFDGVAPGAKVISLKLGHNTLAGGSTTTSSKKRAFEYAARFARERNVTVVCNLSFGIGSIREGHSDIDKFLDRLLRKNPGLIVCTSAGNSGPGLSSVGTPAAANAAISVAALLAVDTARDVRAELIPAPQLTQFSSRGGELDKPDIATPGMATSTVPRWNKFHDFMQGTSMASPYAAGLSALLAQRLYEQGKTVRADWIKLALKAGAAAVPGYTPLDYGAGLPDVRRSADAVDAIAARRVDDPLYAFDVATDCPLAVDGKSRAAYWRSTFIPADRPQTFTIKPVFIPTADAAKITAFSKRLVLSSDADWCKTKQEQIYFRSKQSARVDVEYDSGKLKAPGLYVATIEGVEDGQTLLRLVNSVVVPHRVGPSENYTLTLDDQHVEGWKVRRHFVEVPTGASAMHLKLTAPDGQPSTAQMYYAFRPDGRSVGRRYPVRLDTKNDRLESTHTICEELEPGIWELPITCRNADETSAYRLEVRFDGIHAKDRIITKIDSTPGKKPSGKVILTNVFDRPTTVTTSGLLEGYQKRVTKKLTPDDDIANVSMKLTSAIRAVRVRVEVSDEDYAKFTDCAINIYNAEGKALAQGGLSEPTATLTAANPRPGAETTTCKLEIRPAFTHGNVEDEAVFKVKIDFLYAEPVDINVHRGNTSTITLYPDIPTEFSYKFKSSPPPAAKGASRIGTLRAVERRSKNSVVEIEIKEK